MNKHDLTETVQSNLSVGESNLRQQIIEEINSAICEYYYSFNMAGDKEPDSKLDFSDESLIAFNTILPHLEAQQREIERLREALGDVVSDWPEISSATYGFCKQALAGEEVV